MTYINEGNLYRLIIKSRKPEAEPFESWVCDDVLPSIRKTGSYQSPELQEDLRFQIPDIIHELVSQGVAAKGTIYNRLYRRFDVNSYKDIPLAQCQKAVDYLKGMAKPNHNQAAIKLNDGEHYFVVKDGVVLWEKVLKPNCDDLPSNALKNPALMLEHIRQVVGEFVGKEALPAPKPLIISLPRETARHTQSGANLFSLNILQRAYGVQGNPLAQLFELLATAEQHHQPIIIKDIEGAKAIYDITKELAHQSQYALEMIAQTANKFCSGGSYFGNF